MIPYLDSIGVTVGAAALFTCAALAANTPLNGNEKIAAYQQMAQFQGITQQAQTLPAATASVVVAAADEIPVIDRIVVRPEPRDFAAATRRLVKAESEADALALKLRATEAALSALAERAQQAGDPALSRALEQVRKGLS